MLDFTTGMKAQEVIQKYLLKDRSWTYKGFHGLLHTFFPVGEEPLNSLKNFYGDSFNITLFFVTEDYVNWYWNDEDMIRLRESIVKKVNDNPKFLDKFLEKWHSLVKVFEKEIKKCEKADFSELSDKELLELYDKFYEAYINEYSIAIGLQDPFSMHADRFMKPLLERILKEKGREKKLNEYYAVLTSPTTESFIALEFKDRLRILKKIKKDKELFDLFKKGADVVIKKIENFGRVNKHIEEHSKKYFWIENNYARIKILIKDDFIHKIAHELDLEINPDKEIKGSEDRLKKAEKEKKELIKDLNLDKEFRNLLKITEVFAYMQDERKKYVLISNHYQKMFLAEIGKRLNLSEREMNYTVYPELKEMLLKEKVDKRKLAERYKHCLCVQTLDGYEVFEGKVADEIYDEIFNPDIRVEEIKGSCASQGKATGVVRVVKKVHDLVNVDKGDVLVTTMTRPEMVYAMEKAVAIVTDEGGITCHAAIISRELGIPCIVGTNVATKVLKDGDLVEVDATSGVVKKVKKK